MSSRHGVRDVLTERLSRIEVGPVFTRTYRAAAEAAAEAADARRHAGVSLGPLDGMIVSVKDVFDVAGEVTTAGSAVLCGALPATADAAVVARLRRAGAVIVAKTNMSEFAFSAVGLNPHTGTPGNAADPARIPGGSSSGAGVSVAQGTSDVSIGSDTGGSVRIPAALNGVVGFKPTARRVPLQGAFPLSYSLDSIGPLARTVADCARADAVMAGDEPVPLRPATLTGLRVGLPHGLLLDGLDSIVTAGFERALARLDKAGAALIDHGIDDLLAAQAGATAEASIAAVEAAAVHAGHLDGERARFDPRVLHRIEGGRHVTGASYVTMMRRRIELAAACDGRLAAVDVLVLPTAAVVAPLAAPLVDDAAFTRANQLLLRNTAAVNFFDLTAISLPMPNLPLPAGLMLVARHGHDRRLLEIAAAVEAVL